MSNNGVAAFNVIIAQAQVKSMLFRTCAQCKSKVLVMAVHYAGQSPNNLYCLECRRPATSIRATYRLQFTAMRLAEDRLESYIAYDEALEPIMGCSASDLVERLSAAPGLLDRIEALLLNLHCHLLLRRVRPKKGRATGDQAPTPSSSDVVEAILPVVVPGSWTPIIDQLDAMETPISYDRYLAVASHTPSHQDNAQCDM